MSSDKPTSDGLASIHVFGEQGDRMTYEDCLFLSFLRSALSGQEFPKSCSEQVAHISSLLPSPRWSSLSWEQLQLCLTSALDLMNVVRLHCPLGKLRCCLKDTLWGSCRNKTTAHKSLVLPRAVVQPDPVAPCCKNATRVAPRWSEVKLKRA